MSVMQCTQCTQLPGGVHLGSRTGVRQLYCRPFQRSRNAARLRTTAAASHEASSADIERRSVLLAGAGQLRDDRGFGSQFGRSHAFITAAVR